MIRRELESQHTLVLIPTSSKTNLSESSEKNNVHFPEQMLCQCPSNTLTTESTLSQLLVHFELGEPQVQTALTKQNEYPESSILLLKTADNVTTYPERVFNILTQSDPLKTTSNTEMPIMTDKMSSDLSREEKNPCEDIPTTTQDKPCSEASEIVIQDPMSESRSANYNKNTEYLVNRQNNDSESEISLLLPCPRIDAVQTKENRLPDEVFADSLATFNHHFHRDYYEGKRKDKDKTSSQDCDIFIPDVYVSHIAASDMTQQRQEPTIDESRSEPMFDLVVEENKMYITKEIKHMDIVIPTTQNDNSSPSEINSLAHVPKTDDGLNKQKEDLTQLSPHPTVSQDLHFMADPAVEYPGGFNVLSKCAASKNVSLSQDPSSKEPKLELHSDQPFLTEHKESCDEDDQPLGVLIHKSQTVNETAELSFVVSLPKTDTVQNKQNESLSSEDPEEDDSADVFEKNDNKPFKESASSSDVDVPASGGVSDIEMFNASTKAAPEAVSSRCFGFEKLLPTTFEKPVNDDEPRAGSRYSKVLGTTMEVSETQTLLDYDQALSPSENEYCIPPGYDEVSPIFGSTAVQPKAASPTFELSDTDAYYDCKQGASDLSETEFEETEAKLHQQSYNNPNKQKHFYKTLLPSERDNHEDSPFTYEDFYNVQEENYEDSSDEEFTLCEAPPKMTFCEIATRDSDDDDTNKSMSREIKAELEKLSESSDDEFLTTRIIRRRVIIKADDMADFPPQSISEETYMDENGHTVVKKVTRRVIRKCASSSDGAVPEQVSSEAGAHSSSSASKGDGYSKVVKRTVVKSEGDQSEVTFTECESLSKQDEAGRASRIEKTVVLEGERTITHHGDVSLASDLLSAQHDFKQALSYVSSFYETELPQVVQSETVKDDGNLVKRAQMRKGRSVRKTIVKGAGQRKQVLLEQVEGPRIGSKSSDLKQHLHQLFHHYYEQNHREDTDKENT